MITVKEGSYYKLYESLDTCNKIDDLVTIANDMLKEKESDYWFLEGLAYLSEIENELYKSDITERRLEKLKEILSEKFIYDSYTLVTNIPKFLFIKTYIQTIKERGNIANLIDNSKYFEDEKVKYGTIGQVAVGFDGIGCISRWDLEDTTIDYKISKKEYKKLIKGYIMSPTAIFGFIILAILFALAQFIKMKGW